MNIQPLHKRELRLAPLPPLRPRWVCANIEEGHRKSLLVMATGTGKTQRELLESAAANDVKVYGTQRMWFSRPAPENNVMVGFSAIAHEDIAPGVEALRRAWCSAS